MRDHEYLQVWRCNMAQLYYGERWDGVRYSKTLYVPTLTLDAAHRDASLHTDQPFSKWEETTTIPNIETDGKTRDTKTGL